MFCDFKKSHGEFLVKYTMILPGNQSIVIKVKIYKLKENVFQNKEHCYLPRKSAHQSPDCDRKINSNLYLENIEFKQ